MPIVMPPDARTLETTSGRAVSYYEYGDPSGAPVVALHGTPASGAGFVWGDEAARARGIRLLAPDRPGIGASTRTVLREVVDYVAEFRSTVDALGIEKFSLLGYSGGGPYALAVAHAMPDRVRAAAIIACAGQIGVWAKPGDFETTDRYMTRASLRAPLVARALLASSAWFARVLPPASVRFAAIELSRRDREVLKEFESASAALALFTRAVSNGARGVVDDYAALGRPWGFEVEDVRIPIACWHGTDDRIVPLRHTEALVERVRDAQLVTLPDEGHLAVIDHVAEILDWLSVGRSDHSAR